MSDPGAQLVKGGAPPEAQSETKMWAPLPRNLAAHGAVVRPPTLAPAAGQLQVQNLSPRCTGISTQDAQLTGSLPMPVLLAHGQGQAGSLGGPGIFAFPSTAVSV